MQLLKAVQEAIGENLRAVPFEDLTFPAPQLLKAARGAAQEALGEDLRAMPFEDMTFGTLEEVGQRGHLITL